MDQYKHEATAVTPLVKAEKDTAHELNNLKQQVDDLEKKLEEQDATIKRLRRVVQQVESRLITLLQKR